MDFYNGSEMGRIYRITPAGAMPMPADQDLENASSDELVVLLAHRDGWWRRTAQRLILERQDPSAIPALRKLFESSDFPQARVHALYGLEGLDALENRDLQHALDDSEAGVRLHAIRLAEGNSAFINRISALTEDPSPRVAMQAALSLDSMGSMGGDALISTLVIFTKNHIDNRWMRNAILSSETGASMAFFEALHALVAFKINEAGKTNETGKTNEANGEDGKAAYLKAFAEIVSSRNAPGEIDQLNAMIPGLQVEAPTTNSSP